MVLSNPIITALITQLQPYRGFELHLQLGYNGYKYPKP